MPLPLDQKLRIGIQAFHRPPPGAGAWLPRLADLRHTVELIDRSGYDSIWAGDHISFPIPFLDPLPQIAQAAAFSNRLTFGTAVYLLPLRHPAPVAKEVATLDHLTEGRLIFGVGVGGEFPKEYEACGVPFAERGARMNESIEVLRRFWSGAAATHTGRFFRFSEVPMQPPPRQAGGPPIWTGGRSEAALERAARLGDGWLAYVVTPAMYRDALEKIAAKAAMARRTIERFGSGHLLFACVADSYEQAYATANETLSRRYAMDFSQATKRYAALGRPAEVAARIREFYDAGVRHVILDLLGPFEGRDRQAEWFAAEGLPLLSDVMRR
jgi:probable F420-dependent oxidoreductase